jgi:hypothetical protein
MNTLLEKVVGANVSCVVVLCGCLVWLSCGCFVWLSGLVLWLSCDEVFTFVKAFLEAVAKSQLSQGTVGASNSQSGDQSPNTSEVLDDVQRQATYHRLYIYVLVLIPF